MTRPLSIDNKLLLHRASTRPTLTYGSAVWHNTAQTNLERLRLVDRCALRRIAAPPVEARITNAEILVALDVESLDDFIERTNENFRKKIRHHYNPLIRAIGDDENKKPYGRRNFRLRKNPRQN